MSEVSISSPASVVAGADADFYRGTAGGTITAGMAVYLDETDNTLKAADANTSATEAEVKGIALHGASAGQPLRVQMAGIMTMGGTMTLSTVYILGAGGAGGIAPVVDLASGWYTSILGVGASATTMKIHIFNSRCQKA